MPVQKVIEQKQVIGRRIQQDSEEEDEREGNGFSRQASDIGLFHAQVHTIKYNNGDSRDRGQNIELAVNQKNVMAGFVKEE